MIPDIEYVPWVDEELRVTFSRLIDAANKALLVPLAHLGASAGGMVRLRIQDKGETADGGSFLPYAHDKDHKYPRAIKAPRHTRNFTRTGQLWASLESRLVNPQKVSVGWLTVGQRRTDRQSQRRVKRRRKVYGKDEYREETVTKRMSNKDVAKIQARGRHLDDHLALDLARSEVDALEQIAAEHMQGLIDDGGAGLQMLNEAQRTSGRLGRLQGAVRRLEAKIGGA